MTAVEIRLPELSGGTEAEQLRRIQSYLYTLAQQLQFAFDTVSREQTAASAQGAGTAEKAETTVNFAAIKALIIKSADLTQHFQQEVEKYLTGLYVAQSQFGIFRQETEQRITANSQKIEQKFANLQQLESTVAELQSAVLEVSATIRTGLLAEGADGQSIYGVEIGQQEWENGVIRFRKYARLTSEKLSFYDSNDVEVAYISDRRMYVTAATVAQMTADSLAVQRLALGDYIWEQGADGHLSIR
ncbi:MAG: hypothetical protein ACI3XG_09530 [Faecousia sp.]